MSGKPPKKAAAASTRKKLLIGLVALLAVATLGLGVFLWIYSRDDGLIFDNVYFMDQNLGGMSRQEAEAAIEARTQELQDQGLTVELQDRSLVLTPENTRVEIDAAAVAQAAFDYGREGNMFQRAKARSAAALTSHTLNVTDYLSLDETYIRQAVDQLGAEINRPLVQPTVTVTGEKPDMTKYCLPLPDSDDQQPQEDVTILEILPEEPCYLENGQTMTIEMGVSGQNLDTQGLYTQILRAYTEGNLATICTTYEVTQPDPIDVSALFAEHCQVPVNSELNEETYVASRETLGYGFVAEELQKQIDGAEEGQVLTIQFQVLIPEHTKASLEAELFKDVLVSIKTPHVSNRRRTKNLELACAAIDGYILKPGATFSFNNVVGERTAAKGYQEATVYSGMNSVEELGGGVCQVASTLYYGALLADFKIVERRVHTFAVTYVDYGMDATVYWGSLDFQFQNNTEYPVKIVTSVHDGYVWLEYIGTETKDYYVKMEWVQESRDDWETVEVELTEENAKKYADYEIGDTVVSPYTGRTGYSYKLKYNRETDELISREKEAYSSYARRDKQVLVGPKKPKPTEPEPTEPEPTEPKPTEPEPTEPKPTEPTDPTPTDPTPTDPENPPGGEP